MLKLIPAKQTNNLFYRCLQVNHYHENSQRACALGLKDVIMKGIDLAIHADPSEYREVVSFIKNDSLSLGALVTTHKIDLYKAAFDLFDEMDSYARMFGELSSISKNEGKLCGHAKDPITCGMAMELRRPHIGATIPRQV